MWIPAFDFFQKNFKFRAYESFMDEVHIRSICSKGS